MKLEAIHTDTFQQVLEDAASRTLIMKWLPGTASINYAQFKGALLVFAGFAEQREPHNVLIDSADFRGGGNIPMDEMFVWRTREVIPHYNATGVQQFAFLFGKGASLPPSGNKGEGQDFPTYSFDDMQDVLEQFGAA